MSIINDVRSCKAYHYIQNKIKNIGDCLSQRYDVISLSEAGEVLPEKSIFFYPKPITGTVFYPLEESDE